jgi:hypothetical protein
MFLAYSPNTFIWFQRILRVRLKAFGSITDFLQCLVTLTVVDDEKRGESRLAIFGIRLGPRAIDVYFYFEYVVFH